MPIEQQFCLLILYFLIESDVVAVVVVVDVVVGSRSISENHSIVMNPLECGVFMITRFPSPKRVYIYKVKKSKTDAEEVDIKLNNG